MDNVDKDQLTLETQPPEQAGVTIPEGGSQTDASSGVTQAQFQQMMDTLQQQQEEIRRLKQSQGDKFNHLNNRIAEQMQRLEKAQSDLNLTDEEVAGEKKRIRSEALASYLEQGGPAAQPPPPEPDNKIVLSMEDQSRLNLAVSKMQVDLDTALMANDEEFKALQKLEQEKPMTMDEWLLEYKKALENKAKRSGKTVVPPTDAAPGARTPGASGATGGTNPIENITDPRELISLGLKKMGQRR